MEDGKCCRGLLGGRGVRLRFRIAWYQFSSFHSGPCTHILITNVSCLYPLLNHDGEAFRHNVHQICVCVFEFASLFENRKAGDFGSQGALGALGRAGRLDRSDEPSNSQVASHRTSKAVDLVSDGPALLF
jgi:hypothetical protein